MADTIEIDDVIFNDSTDFAQLVRDVLKGKTGARMPHDLGRSDWLLRAYLTLQGTPFDDRLTAAIAECITANDPTVRSGALLFFVKFPDALGADRLVDAALNHRHLFEGIPSFEGGRVDLLLVLLRGVSARIMLGDDQALELGRREALKPRCPQQLIAALTHKDADWVVEHADRIVRLSPDAGLPILVHLHQANRDILELGTRIAPHAKDDELFLELLDRVIGDPSICRAIHQAAEESDPD